MNGAISGWLVEEGTDRPLAGLVVVVARASSRHPVPLGTALTEDWGRFRIEYPRFTDPVDLTLLVLDPVSGDQLFIEPVHRSVVGYELNVTVQVPVSITRRLTE